MKDLNMDQNSEQHTKKNFIGFFILFLILGLSIFTFTTFMDGIVKIVYLICLPILFAGIAIIFKKKKQEILFQIFYAFFSAAVVHFVQLPWGAGTTMENIVYNKLISTALVIIPIIILNKIAGNNLDTIFLKRGNLKLGLIIGLGTFLIFLFTALPLSTLIFNAQNLTLERAVSWTPWVLLFIFANGIKEELLFRGLFLRKFQNQFGTDKRGADGSLFLSAIIFSLAHISSPITPFTFIYLALTFFLGLAFGAITQKTDSLLGAILFHAGTDIPVILGVLSVLA